MLMSSSSTSPVTLAPGVSSCMRFRQRSRVLLPHPDGPMIAVTVCAGKRNDTSRTARCCPNSAVRCAVSSWSRVLADATITLPRHPTGQERDDEHEANEYQRGCPRETVPVLEGAGGVYVDLQRQRLHRLRDVHGEVDVSERREEERGGLAGDSGDAHEAARHDPAERGARHDLEGGAPAGIAERQRGFAQRVRHETHHFF